MMAWAVYVLGTVLALKSVVSGASGDMIATFTGIAVGVVLWWIAAGVGIRLGVPPREFIASLKACLGLEEPAGNDSVQPLVQPSAAEDTDPAP